LTIVHFASSDEASFFKVDDLNLPQKITFLQHACLVIVHFETLDVENILSLKYMCGSK
jgi:hypothetical protein